MSTNRPQRLFSSPAWLYQLDYVEKFELILLLTCPKYNPTTQSLNFGEENRWLPRTLINHIQEIERQIMPSPDKPLDFGLITEENIDIVIWLAILSLGKFFFYDTEVIRSRLHVMDESRGGVIRQAYGIALVEYFPAINNSQGISHPQGPTTQTSFYRWGYVDQLRGHSHYPESSERESLRAYRLEPTFYVLPTVRSPLTAMATRNAIRSLWNVQAFCIELSQEDCRMEYAVPRHQLLLQEVYRDAAEILEIGRNYMVPKSWENHVIGEYIKYHLRLVLALLCRLLQERLYVDAGEENEH